MGGGGHPARVTLKQWLISFSKLDAPQMLAKSNKTDDQNASFRQERFDDVRADLENACDENEKHPGEAAIWAQLRSESQPYPRSPLGAEIERVMNIREQIEKAAREKIVRALKFRVAVFEGRLAAEAERRTQDEKDEQAAAIAYEAVRGIATSVATNVAAIVGADAGRAAAAEVAAKQRKAGRPASYDWGGLEPVLEKYVAKHGPFESKTDLANWARRNVKLVAGERTPKGADSEPGFKTALAAVDNKKYRLAAIGLKPPAANGEIIAGFYPKN